jgi:hypothetical protein
MAKTQNEVRGTAAALEGADSNDEVRIPPPPPPSGAPAEPVSGLLPTGASPPPVDRYGPRLGVGLPVHVCDHETGKIHAAVVTHVTEGSRNIVATVFKPHETVAGVGFTEADHGLATPGRWLLPDWMTGE